MKHFLKMMGAVLLSKEAQRSIRGGYGSATCTAWCDAERTRSVSCPELTGACSATDNVGVECDGKKTNC